MDHCKHGDMRHLIRSRTQLTEPEVKYFALNILNGIQYLHSQLIIHRDIKLENILLCGDDLVPKITDFGLAVKLKSPEDCIVEAIGTPNYMAPEVLMKKCYSYSADIWSFGVLIYTLFVGRPAFETTKINNTYRRIKDAVYYFPDRVKLSNEAKDFIKSILVVDVNKRATIDQLKKHPFLTEGFIPKSLPLISILMKPDFNKST